MDTNVQRIADYAHSLSFADLPASVVHDCKRRLVDTLGCALAAFDAEPAKIARRNALRVSVPGGACVIGTSHRTLPELATFANGVMIRYLDGNDTYPGGGGHPSDLFAAILSVADATQADGKTVITAAVLGYEIYASLFAAAVMRERGMDHVFYTAVGSAVATAKILGLKRDVIAEAIALAITPNLALEVTRRGSLSMWKGCAAANGARNGVFAALLAADGMTGPDQVIDGGHGLRELVGKFELPPLAPREGPYRLSQSNIKGFLSEYHSQGPIALALQLRAQLKADDIEAVEIFTYWFTWSEIGSEPEKWRPTTRETADHSLPFMIACVLLEGRFSDEFFSPSYLNNPAVHRMADRIKVTEDPALSARFPAFVPCRFEITTRSGEKKVATTDYPRGYHKNPLSDDEVFAKFRDLAGRALSSVQVESVIEQVMRFEHSDNPAMLLATLKIKDGP
ncbi:MAG: MmgE/PrpD family protein [Betaproteobacteria bacterium]|nr:MmgE/PrpD family protein [Betaproteobacteria bacterium]